MEQTPARLVILGLTVLALTGCADPADGQDPEEQYDLREHPEDWTLVEAYALRGNENDGTYTFKLEFLEWERGSTADLWFYLNRYENTTDDEPVEILFDEWSPVAQSDVDDCMPINANAYCVDVVKRMPNEWKRCTNPVFATSPAACKHDLAMTLLLPNGTAHWKARESTF